MKNINDLTNQLKKVEKEIEEYQEECKHEKQHIKTISTGKTRWVCDECMKELRIPSPNEIQQYLGEGKKNPIKNLEK